MAKGIGLYGGSFDPIHIGHLIVAQSVAERLGLKQVIFLPSAHPPHKTASDLVDGSHRAAMVRCAIEGEPLFAFSDFDLTQGGPTYTVDTIAHFREELGSVIELHWIIGADSLAELTTWHRVGALLDSCRIVTASRPECGTANFEALRPTLSDRQIERLSRDILDTPGIDISATDVRRRIRNGDSIRYLVPDAVRTYIEKYGLYRDDADPH